MTGQYLISTQAVEGECRCGSAILVGIAEGEPVRTDVRPVDRAGEIAALLDSRWTYALTRGRLLVRREPGRIRTGLVGESIHAQHRCPPTHVQLTLIGAIP